MNESIARPDTAERIAASLTPPPTLWQRLRNDPLVENAFCTVLIGLTYLGLYLRPDIVQGFSLSAMIFCALSAFGALVAMGVRRRHPTQGKLSRFLVGDWTNRLNRGGALKVKP